MSTSATRAITLGYVKTIGICNNGYNGRGFTNPYDTAIAKDGRIFVLNRCDPARFTAIRVGVCNLDEDYLGEFGQGGGTMDGQFVWPVAMDFDSQERLYITDEQTHRITVFDTDGNFINKWGHLGSDDGQLDGPAGIAIDSVDGVYVADQHNNRIQKFDTNGVYLLQWGWEGGGDGQFRLPWGVAVDAGSNVYVADWGNDRIQKFDSQGKFLASYGQPGQDKGQFHRPAGVAVDPEGYIYVADWGNERVQVLAPDGGFRLLLRGQGTLSKWAQEYFISNPEEKKERDVSNLTPPMPAHLQTPYHESSQSEPYFWGPVSVTLDREGRLYVTEANRHRLQVYQKH